MSELNILNFPVFPKRFGFYPYIFLLFLIGPLSYIIRADSSWKFWIGIVLVILFLISYRELYWLRHYHLWLGVQIGIIFLFTVLYNPYNILLGFFSASFIGWYMNDKLFKRAYNIFFLVKMTELVIFYASYGIQEFINISILFIIMLISPIAMRSMNRQMELEEKLKEANQQIKALIKREERLRISRDLHDTLGHTLSTLNLQAQLVQKLIQTNPEQAKKTAKEIEDTSRAALRQVRELVSDMRELKIAEVLPEIDKTLAAAGILFIHNAGKIDFDTIPLINQNIISMCLREAITNVVKHSRAKNCYLTFQQSAKSLIITIEDDGIGMKMNKTNGNGIQGMKERLSIIDGVLSIASNHQGTTVTLKIPIIQKQQKEVTAG